jgi:hypothetical protein
MTTPPQQPGYPEQPTNPYGVPAYPGGVDPQQPTYPQQPGYGQQPGYPGQPPYPQQPGYQQPAYPGQPYPAYPAGGYGAPGYPGPGYGAPAHPAPVRPSSVTTAFALWMLILVVSIVSSALLFTGGYYDELQAALDRMDLSGAESDLALSAGKTVLIIGGVLGLAISLFIYLFFGLKMWAGRNWSRIVLTVLGGVSVVFGAAGNSVTEMNNVNVARPEGSVILGWLSVILAAAAIIAMYVPTSNTYFRESKLHRSTPR